MIPRFPRGLARLAFLSPLYQAKAEVQAAQALEAQAKAEAELAAYTEADTTPFSKADLDAAVAAAIATI